MIEVRIRSEQEVKAVHLAEVPFDKIGTVIPTLNDWGIGDHDGELSGQFVLDEELGVAFFEIMLVDPDA